MKTDSANAKKTAMPPMTGEMESRHFPAQASWWRTLIGKPLRVFVLMLTDVLWSLAIPALGVWLYRTIVPEMTVPETFWQDCGIIAGTIVVINAFGKCYHGNLLNPGAAINRVEEIRRVSLAVLGAYFLGCFFCLLAGRVHDYPLLPVLGSLIITAVGFPTVRFLSRLVMKKLHVGQIRVFIAGAGKTGMTVSRELQISSYYGYDVVGYFDDDAAKKELSIHGQKVLGRICDAPRMAQYYGVDSIICCLPPVQLSRITKSYSHTFKHVLVVPSAQVLPITAIYPTLIGFVSGFEFQNRILFLFPRIFKRMMEVVLSLFGIILLLPLFVVLALAVKLSSAGPIFYTAKRLGMGGREIKVFKFRTMYQDAESQLETMLEENPEMKTEWAERFKLQKDPRITRIGHFLRKTSLDELPQFINVIRGEMALIGPRPIVKDEVHYYGEAYDYLKRVRPGITGLWQVSGRNNVNYAQRVAMDMFYVMNWSFWLDWYVLGKTVLEVISSHDSY